MSADPRVEAVLAAAAAISDRKERAAYVDQACAEDAGRRREVESLLAAHDEAGTFLQQPAPGAPLGVPPSDGPHGVPPLGGSDAEPAQAGTPNAQAEQEGDRIGRYKLLEKIGTGGFGDVWMAEQEEPVRRRIALKVIKRGMDTREVIARFEAERQALALMDHPNIAKVHDGGATESGRPYFVMELVRGIRITDYCNQNNLPTAERLTLFAKVCRAIQHAHQKGIIHRDIKPSNVLVTVNDGAPVPKVIDFGIAKATEQRLTDKTVFTRFMQFLGTPAYMSPEQAELTSLDIDTRSDIYSLGVLLYELLTGRTPFDTKALLAAGLDEMRRVIREVEPPTPSTRLKQERSAPPGSASKSAIRNPQSAIDPDLDWIVMKCLEKDRTRRYETANGLATDLQRHLNSEPILARPPSTLYRWQKFARKHRTGMVLAAAFTLLLTAAAVVSTAFGLWAYRERKAAIEKGISESVQRARAETKEKAAQTEAAKRREMVHFLKSMLKGAAPSTALGRDTTMLREIVDETAERVTKELKGQPEIATELSTTLGGLYHDLGLYDQSEQMGREALRLSRLCFGENHPMVAKAMALVGDALSHRGDCSQAEPFLRQAVVMLRETGERHELIYSLQRLALSLSVQNRGIEAEILAREALTNSLNWDSPDSTNSIAWSHNVLGTILFDRGALAEAEAHHREALALRRRQLGNKHPWLAKTLVPLAEVVQSRGDPKAAETLLREALAIGIDHEDTESPEHRGLSVSLARVLRLQRKDGEAETVLRGLLERARRRYTNDPVRLERVLASAAGELFDARRFAEAESLSREVLQSRRNRLAADDASIRHSMEKLALLLMEWTWLENARRVERAMRRKIDEPTAPQPQAPPSAAPAQPPLVERSILIERAYEAERLLRQCLAMQVDAQTNAGCRLPNTQSGLGGALILLVAADTSLSAEARLAKLAEAETLLLQAHDALRPGSTCGLQYLENVLIRLVRLYGGWDSFAPNTGQAAKLAEWKRKLEQFDNMVAAQKLR